MPTVGRELDPLKPTVLPTVTVRSSPASACRVSARAAVTDRTSVSLSVPSLTVSATR